MECLIIRATGSELDRFEAAGYLDPEKRGDRAAKAHAIECFITAFATLAAIRRASPRGQQLSRPTGGPVSRANCQHVGNFGEEEKQRGCDR